MNSTNTCSRLYEWARRTSGFGDLVEAPATEVNPDEVLAYRLKSWPDLPASMRKAGVYRAMSVMTHRPVSHAWLRRNTLLAEAELERLLQRLMRDDALRVIDVSLFAAPLNDFELVHR